MALAIKIIKQIKLWAKGQRLDNVNDDMYIGARNDIIDSLMVELDDLLTQIKK